MVNIRRGLRHLFMPLWAWRRAFPKATLDAIEAAIRTSETRHGGEIRFAIENNLSPSQVWRGLSGRARAIEVFSELRVWDTADNTGVLIYVLLADHDIEIVADRGIAAQVSEEDWLIVVRILERHFRSRDYRAGALAGIEAVSKLLERHVPPGDDNPDELANRPVILRR